MSTGNPLSLSIFNAEGGESSAGFGLNNPGDIFDPTTGQLQSFPTLQQGWDALDAQVGKYLTGQSQYADGTTPIAQLAPIYTGNDNPEGWASAVAQGVGVTPQDSIATAASSTPSPSLLSKWGQYFSGSGASAPGSSSGAPGFLSGLLPGSILGNLTGAGTVGQVFSSLLSSRFVIGAIGVLLIAGGVFGFRAVQDTVVSSARTARDAAQDGAEAA